MSCETCITTKEKISALEDYFKIEGVAFIRRDGAIKMIPMIRDECRHKNTGKTECCRDGACADGGDVWEGRV